MKFGEAFWDEKFAGSEYVFGEEPAVFLVEQAHHLPAGARVLSLGDGEGRNAVFLAQQGHRVLATDVSEQALAKSKRLAEARGVEVELQKADMTTWRWPTERFDAVVAIFVQVMGGDARTPFFTGLKQAVVPGGLVLLHGYDLDQLQHGTGGPPHPENLYTTDLLQEAFADFEILRLVRYERELQEGVRHVGRSALIDLVARRPA